MERVMKRPEMEMSAEMPIESKEVEKKRKDELDRKDRDPREGKEKKRRKKADDRDKSFNWKNRYGLVLSGPVEVVLILVQKKPVAVMVAPQSGQKTGLDRTSEH